MRAFYRNLLVNQDATLKIPLKGILGNIRDLPLSQRGQREYVFPYGKFKDANGNSSCVFLLQLTLNYRFFFFFLWAQGKD